MNKKSQDGAYDAVIIGGGHNGLVCAFYLARAGMSVRVLERRSLVGGAAVTEEFHPGFRNSTASYTVSLLNPKVIADMKLKSYGLQFVRRPIANFLPTEDGRYLKVGGGLQRTQAEVAQFSERDAEKLPLYFQRLETVAAFLRQLTEQTPPGRRQKLKAIWTIAGLTGRVIAGGPRFQRDALDLFTKSARAFLERWFESAPLQAVLGFDSVVGNYAGPSTPGSAYVLLHHVFGEVDGVAGEWGHAIGGMGAITDAMRKACIEAGVEISVDTPVNTVLIDDKIVRGVTTEDDREVLGSRVVSNVNPKVLYGTMVEQTALEPEFAERMKSWRCASGTFRMNVALSELPDFECLPGKELAEHHQAGIILAPTLDYMDRAFEDAQREGWSKDPIVEMVISSALDDSLAPKGAHVASLFCQQFAPELPNGRSWHDARDQAADVIIETVNRFAPNFKSSVIARQCHSPLDLEEKFGLTGGDIMHGQMTLNQLWALRPAWGHGDYRGPLQGLYMCGAGSHPGGGVTGLPGRNAAREILWDADLPFKGTV